MKVIAIAGASASGKTYIAAALHKYLSNKYGEAAVVSFSEDCYYKHTPHLSMQQRGQINFDHPDAFEHELLVEHLNQLKQGGTIELPQYCFKTHLRLDHTVAKKSTDWLILEGLHLFHRQKIVDIFDAKVYVDAPVEVCLERRIIRDQQQRNRTLESIHQQFEATVKPMFLKYIEPTKSLADIVLDGTADKQKNMKILTKFLE
jgi:uridine kinase